MAKSNEVINKALKSGDLAKGLVDIVAEGCGGTSNDLSNWRVDLVRYEGFAKLTGVTRV